MTFIRNLNTKHKNAISLQICFMLSNVINNTIIYESRITIGKQITECVSLRGNGGAPRIIPLR